MTSVYFVSASIASICLEIIEFQFFLRRVIHAKKISFKKKRLKRDLERDETRAMLLSFELKIMVRFAFLLRYRKSILIVSRKSK